MLHLSRVLSGTARAHEMLQDYTQHINMPPSAVSVTRLVDWKDSRVIQFDKPLARPPGSSFLVFSDLSKNIFARPRSEGNNTVCVTVAICRHCRAHCTGVCLKTDDNVPLYIQLYFTIIYGTPVYTRLTALFPGLPR